MNESLDTTLSYRETCHKLNGWDERLIGQVEMLLA